MLRTLAISNYRSIRDLVLPLTQLNVVIGANGVGKSNPYKALRTLAETATGSSVETLSREGGLASVLWAGPEHFPRRSNGGLRNSRRTSQIRGSPAFWIRERTSFGYAIDYGLPQPVPGSMFTREPKINREVICEVVRTIIHGRLSTARVH